MGVENKTVRRVLRTLPATCYPKKLIGQSWHTGNLPVNAPGQIGVVSVFRTDDDTAMNRDGTMEPHEIPAIERDEATVSIDGISQHGVVLDSLIRPAHVVRRQHIVPKTTKFTHDIDREVLICVKPCHSPPSVILGLVFGNLTVDLPRMAGHILPGIQQI
jgi:hypothetical protein